MVFPLDMAGFSSQALRCRSSSQTKKTGNEVPPRQRGEALRGADPPKRPQPSGGIRWQKNVAGSWLEVLHWLIVMEIHND